MRYRRPAGCWQHQGSRPPGMPPPPAACGRPAAGALAGPGRDRYLLQSRVGPQAEVTSGRSTVTGSRSPNSGAPTSAAWPNWWETYLDLPLGIVDAAVAVIAERLGPTEIATLDHRHFTVIRPRHVQAFTLLPGPGHALSGHQRRSVLAVGRKPGHIRHCRSVITQCGKKTIGSERENRRSGRLWRLRRWRRRVYI